MESQIWCHLSVVLCRRGLGKETILLPGLWSFVWEEGVPKHSPWCQTIHFLPIYHLCPSSCCPGAWAQRKWVCINLKSVAGLLCGKSWESCNFFHCTNPHWFLHPEVMGTYLPGSGTLGIVIWVALGSLTPEVSFQIFIYHMCGTTCSASLCLHGSPHVSVSLPLYLSVWMWLLLFLGCWTSIQLKFLIILGDSCFVVLVVIIAVVVWVGKLCLPMPPY